MLVPILIFIHAVLGGIALLSGGLALGFIKGSKNHKNSGKVFYYSLLVSAFLAVFISLLPKHESPFLFCIGLFATYFLLSGKSSIRLKKEVKDLKYNKTVGIGAIGVGMGLLLMPVLLGIRINIIYFIFGGISIGFGIRDLVLFRKPKELPKKWLKLHLSSMLGGYISAFSAFLVVNNIFPVALLNWLLPSVVGTVYIIFWIRKMDGL